MARGFSQEYEIDYEEKISLVVKMIFVRTLIAIVSSRKWPLFHMNVKNAFLHNDLSKVVYMQPPPGVSAPPSHVCHLYRAIYGLKQGPRA